MPDLSPPAGDPPILPRRKAAPARDAALEADRAEDYAGLADTVKALSERLEENFPGNLNPLVSEAEARSSRRWKKKQQPPELPEPDTPLPARTPPVRAGLPRKPLRRPPKKRRFPVQALIGAQIFGFSLIGIGFLASYWFNQPDSSASAAAPAPALLFPGAATRGVSERGFQAVNRAMAAARRGDAGAAREALQGAQRNNVEIPGVDYRLALLAIQRGDLKEAKLRLDSAMAANQEMAACCYVRAMLAGAMGDYTRASEECARAAYAQPFNARYLFFWAECLRRNGKMQSAAERFEEALTRPASPAEIDYMQFKQRLAKIEAGRSSEFIDELGQQLAAESPAPLWLLTAAALSLEAKDPMTAAGHFQAAAKAVAPSEFDLYTRDYLFIAHANEKEVAPYFMRRTTPVSPSPNVAAITVDPVSWSLQSADPGSWPTAAHAP